MCFHGAAVGSAEPVGLAEASYRTFLLLENSLITKRVNFFDFFRVMLRSGE